MVLLTQTDGGSSSIHRSSIHRTTHTHTHSLLLSTVSGEGAKERTDRVLLTPWVKFLWESYRNMLELLKNNLVNLAVYTEVAKRAFKFCLNYQRRMEFRKLCDIVSFLSLLALWSEITVILATATQPSCSG